ncbi:hypothetical protein [Gordonibacter sp. An230]|uniref:hypothetical protein n=1 Tax=Gordonibacter sp. An230 TaxID=1965592 RepID=UPI001EF47FCD|nr:hypothetical protein [Gordonibacter sp. An230]
MPLAVWAAASCACSDPAEDAANATAPDAAATGILPFLRKEATTLQTRLDAERKAGLLSDEGYVAYERTLALVDRALRLETPGRGIAFDDVKALFAEMADDLDARVEHASAALDNAFRFVEDAFGEGRETLLLVTDLSASRFGMAFINDHGCERYFARNDALLFHERGADLAERINRLNLAEDDGVAGR